MKSLVKSLLCLSVVGLYGCGSEEDSSKITFVTSSLYPPFEYVHAGELTGFDIDLAKAVAAEMGREPVFEDRDFNAVFPTLQSGQVDAAIGTLTITPAREKNFAFTAPYYHETMAVVYRKDQPLETPDALQNHKVMCQLGSTMEIWLKKTVPSAEVITLDKTNQAIEALKAGQVDAVVLDGAQAALFVQQNPTLGFAILGTSNDGYGIALRKDSPLLPEINAALEKVRDNGTLQKLQDKWLGETAQ